jgi:hypothetical protein
LISQGVKQLVGEPIQTALISNGWRTSAASQGAGGYSTCVQATTAKAQHMLVVVQSGNGTRHVSKDPAASQVCADQKRVVHWTKLNEAMAGAAE